MKYYLLTFNEYYADEHNVPALACFNQEEYDKWLKRPSGTLNKGYDIQIAVWNKQMVKYEEWGKWLRGNSLARIPYASWTREQTLYRTKHEVSYSVLNNKPRKLKQSGINASLGNGGDNFEDAYMDLYLMEEFITAGHVEVKKVDESFYIIFNEAKLADLSLCNIFSPEEFYLDEYDEDEEEEESTEGRGIDDDENEWDEDYNDNMFGVREEDII